ncbi:hypothetical protein OJ997_08825 [Solirubrobacter phytolaccae]|uniref:DUF3592 domain-containing protein n=1 Tax=Solirubrobacter phytolaccae TaxID=1404360 RepID=A0A9X3S6X3_9ACTN|nr:hypothetical protein [Solirubrobacter phytolaccae]MDA0180394.1 hypothetical protein [Solirubrobacter phytolaccae]
MGPGLLRRAPRGWLPARAISLKHSVRSHHYGSEGAPEIETTFALRVRWRIEVAGREPYEVEEQRDGPAWLAGGGVGGGNRWYKVRVRPQYGLMKDVPVPCFVNPADPSDLWIDWDAAYDAHEGAWEREARIRRAVSDASNPYDKVVGRLTNPFAGRVRAEDEAAEAEARIEREKPPPPAAPGPPGPFEVRLAELGRIKDTGRKTRATVMAHTATPRSMFGMPVVMLTFFVEGRTVEFEHCYGPRHLKHYKVGREVDVWIDPDNPDALCPGQ